ncbi:MAG: TolC family protein [Rhodothermales bacterium]
MNPTALRLSLLLACLAAVPAVAQDHARDTLKVTAQDAVLRALEASPEMSERAANENYAVARMDLARASRFLTDFTVTTAHAPAPGVTNPNDVPTDQLYLDPAVRNDWNSFHLFNRVEAKLLQPLYTWGELSGSIRAAGAGVAVEEATTAGKAEEVAARTAGLYYDLVLADALERLTGEAGSIVDRAKREIRRLLDEGEEGVDDADLFQVLITEQEFNRRVVEVREKLATARTALRRQLFFADSLTLSPAAESLEMIPFQLDSLTNYQAMALSNRPELQKGRAGLTARSALVSVARSGLYPKLFAGASYSYRYTPDRYRQPNPYIGDKLRGQSLEAGIGVRQNLNFAQTKAKIRQAEAERDEVEFQLDAGRQLVLFEVEQAYRQVRIASAAVEAQEEALRISREWLQTESINFDLDLGDTENLVKAVQANLGLQATRHQTVRDYNVAVIQLLKSTGTLVSAIRGGTLVD